MPRTHQPTRSTSTTSHGRKDRHPVKSLSAQESLLYPGALLRFHSSGCNSPRMTGTERSCTGKENRGANVVQLDATFIPSRSTTPDRVVVEVEEEREVPVPEPEPAVKKRSTVKSISVADNPSDAIDEDLMSPYRNAAASEEKRGKRCASCATKKTPYWREGWSPCAFLCNACGIRYRKYKKYCLTCKQVARKDDMGSLKCPNCRKTL